MNFFEQQDQARHNTSVLVSLFVVAIAGIICTLYLSIALILCVSSQGDVLIGWNSSLFMMVAITSIMVIAYGSLTKWQTLKEGGHMVAVELGGRYINPDSPNAQEQQLLNVVSEVAIASGVSVPDLYLLEAERGINAFAAGLTPDTAVIGITRGCLDQLDRDELQGVIAHEFSHILNGDMHLNLRLMGVVHGIVVIFLLGRMCLYSTGHSRWGSSGRSTLFWIAVGIALMTIGGIGVLCGRMIKSSISRQREFLADASAVQFTRNSDGLVGALSKIHNSAFQSFIATPQAEAASHMFFGKAVQGSWSWTSLLETHPPIRDRLIRLGVSPRALQEQSRTSTSSAVTKESSGTITGFQSSTLSSSAQDVAPPAINPETLLAGIGTVSQAQLNFSRMLLEQIPTELKSRMTSVEGSQAIIFALFIDSDPQVQNNQLQQLESSPAQHDAIMDILPALNQCDPRFRLPLIDLVVPSLRQQKTTELRQFQRQVKAIRNPAPSLKNFALPIILDYRLTPYLYAPKPPTTEFTTVQQVWPDFVTVLSTLAIAGQENPTDQLYVLREGLSRLQTPQRSLPEELTVPEFRVLEESLKRLEQATPKLKQQIVNACTHTALMDNTVTLEESELLRAIVIALGCPMPPILTRVQTTSKVG